MGKSYFTIPRDADDEKGDFRNVNRRAIKDRFRLLMDDFIWTRSDGALQETEPNGLKVKFQMTNNLGAL
jgi:hypothetical protein